MDINYYIISGLLVAIIILLFMILRALSSIITEVKYSTVGLINASNEVKESMESMSNPYNQFETIDE